MDTLLVQEATILTYDEMLVKVSFKKLEDQHDPRGSFEWVGGTNEDQECGGGLWITWDDEAGHWHLDDYDGVFSLPHSVEETLKRLGVLVDEDVK